MNAQSSVDLINPDRRRVLNTAAMGVVAAGIASLLPIDRTAGSPSHAIRPFHVNIPDEDLIDLRQRLAATRWPDSEIVTDQSQGVKLATMQQLVRYWQTDYDWRKVETRLKHYSSSSQRSTVSTFISSTFHPNTTMHFP